MSDLRKELETASYSCDISKIAEILAEGADINELEHGDTVLTDTISHLFDHPRRYEIVKFLLDKGADPNLGEEGCGPLFQAILHMDAEMIELLCTHGANPNLDIEGEALYDYAIFDYDYEIYDLKLPEDSNEDDEKDEDSWLGYLQRLAEKYNNKEPKHLFVLRKFGAKS
ncbi:MAG: ankyrin repeat domain-containing protein, partial [Nitrospinae bacterium]|nr:ankyrin repeat domain-containing protein [Nitrospinota bacterium]